MSRTVSTPSRRSLAESFTSTPRRRSTGDSRGRPGGRDVAGVGRPLGALAASAALSYPSADGSPTWPNRVVRAPVGVCPQVCPTSGSPTPDVPQESYRRKTRAGGRPRRHRLLRRCPVLVPVGSGPDRRLRRYPCSPCSLPASESCAGRPASAALRCL